MHVVEFFRFFATQKTRAFASEENTPKNEKLTNWWAFLFTALAGLEPATHGLTVRCSTDWAKEPNILANVNIILYNN